MLVQARILAEELEMTIIAGDVFSAFKAAGVDGELAKRAAAEIGDIKDPTHMIKEHLGRIEIELTNMSWTLGITAPQIARDRRRRLQRRRITMLPCKT
jgi:hypothetical protein